VPGLAPRIMSQSDWPMERGGSMAHSRASLSDDAAANRELRTRVNGEYADKHAFRAWAAEEITWGIFDIPEAQIGLLGDVAGLDVVELGCGTAYLSAWLARRGARPTGVDLAAAQLNTARRCQDRFGVAFPLVEADAGKIPLPGGSFDLAVSECGASLWCDPDRWVPEAARLLRPGGRLVFHTTSVLAALCTARESRHAGKSLARPQRDVTRVDSPGHGVEFHPSHGQWIMILRKAGFVVDALDELYAPPGAATHPYYGVASAQWASRWPAEELWAVHLPKQGESGDG
jgi:SAM-dependent methyltransferase